MYVLVCVAGSACVCGRVPVLVSSSLVPAGLDGWKRHLGTCLLRPVRTGDAVHLLDVPAWRNWADKTALTQNTDRSMHSARTDGKALGGRSFDALSPLLHEYTYQAMVHDLISLDNGTCMFSLAVAPLQAAALSASRRGARLSFLPLLVAARLAHVSHAHT